MLSTLERDGIVTRTVNPEAPPHDEYDLTPPGRSLEVPIRAVAEWAERNMPRITRARVPHDRRAA